MDKKIINSAAAPSAIGPYSQAVLANGMLYVSGQIAYEASLNADFESETKAVMDNIGHILKEAGATYANIVKATIFLKDMANFPVLNEVYGSYFISDFPARETVQVSMLPKNVNVEISVIAVLP